MSKQGILKESAGTFSKKKKFWVVIEEKRLCFYREDKKTLSDELQLAMIQEVTSIDKKSFCIKASTRSCKLIADSTEEKESWISAIKSAKDLIKSSSKKVSQDDFEVLALIGKGNFGKVYQVRKKDTGEIYALKILYKQNIIESNETAHTMSERSILQRIRHPFLVNLYYSFQTEDKLFLVMDFVNGGELFFHLQQEDCFSEERARFYAAEILLGLEHLHENGIIYRDLKLENLLLTPDGHIKITDFGLSKEGMHSDAESTKTFCGTPEYMAPEMLTGKGYTTAVDWWSFGSLLYEMLSGLPPFFSQDVQVMYRRIIKEELSFSDVFSEDAMDLLEKLLAKDPAQRLTDTKVMKAHPFFKTIDWDLLYQKKIKPPYEPDVTDSNDLRNIDEEFTQENPQIEDTETNLSKAEQIQFSGFTYVGDEAK